MRGFSRISTMTRHYCWVACGEKHVEMAERSARLAEGIDHLTLGGTLTIVHLDRFDMQQNVLAQARHLCSDEVAEGDEVVFLDNDALLVKPLPALGDCNVGVTWRDNMGDVSMLMPYNYGVVMAKKCPDTIAAWFWMCDHISKQQPKNQNWYGNQVALRELVGGIGNPERDHGYFKVKTLHLPCETYNWTPETEGEDFSDKYVVHCKGNRKDMLDHYYSRIMEAA